MQHSTVRYDRAFSTVAGNVQYFADKFSQAIRCARDFNARRASRRKAELLRHQAVGPTVVLVLLAGKLQGYNGNFASGTRYIKIPRNPRSHCFTLIHETGTCQAHCNRIVFAFLATYSCAKILNHVTGIMQLVRYYVKNILSRERIQCFAHPPAAPAVSMSRHHNKIMDLFNYYMDCG